MWGLPIELVLVVAVPIGVVALGLLRRYIPALRMVGSPVEVAAVRRAELAEHELASANVLLAKQEARLVVLERERSLASVLDLIGQVSTGVDQTLAKLSELNGGLQASAHAHETAAATLLDTNDAIKASTKAIEFIAGQIINGGAGSALPSPSTRGKGVS